MLTKGSFRPSKISEFSMNLNSICRIKIMLKFGKLLITAVYKNGKYTWSLKNL